MNSKHSSSLVFAEKENFSSGRMDCPTQMPVGDNTLNESGGLLLFQIGDYSNQNESMRTPPRKLLCLESGMRITNTFYTNITGVTSCCGCAYLLPVACEINELLTQLRLSREALRPCRSFSKGDRDKRQRR